MKKAGCAAAQQKNLKKASCAAVLQRSAAQKMKKAGCVVAQQRKKQEEGWLRYGAAM
jgi:hypothetical protein